MLNWTLLTRSGLVEKYVFDDIYLCIHRLFKDNVNAI